MSIPLLNERRTLEIFVEGEESLYSEVTVERLGEYLRFVKTGEDKFSNVYSKNAEWVLHGGPPPGGFLFTDIHDATHSSLFKGPLSNFIAAVEVMREHYPSGKREVTFLMQPGYHPGIGLHVSCLRLRGKPGVDYFLRINDAERDDTYPIVVKEIK